MDSTDFIVDGERSILEWTLLEWRLSSLAHLLAH